MVFFIKRNSVTGSVNQPLQPSSQQKISSLPGATAILGQAWSIYKRRLGTFLGIILIPILIMTLLPSKFAAGGVGFQIVSAILFSVVIFISQAWGQIALIYAIKDSQEGIGITESYRRGWHKILSYLWVLLLAGFITFCGLLLLIVPGIIFSVWFSLAVFVLIAEDLTGINALLKSREYVKGRWGSVFWRILFIGLFSLLLSFVSIFIFKFLKIPFAREINQFVMGLILTPLVMIYSFLVYKNLKVLKGEFVFSPIRGKKANLFLVISIFASFGIGIFIGKQRGVATCPVCKPEEVDFSLFWETWNVLKEKFYEPEKLDTQKMTEGAISGMVKSLDDPYTEFFNPQETKEFFEEAQGTFEGIGIEIDKKKEELVVIAPLEGTPAAKAGLRAGDRILKIGDKETVDLSLEEAVKLIRGPKGTAVALTILRKDWEEPKEFKITRAVIKVPSLKWELKDGNVAYIKLYQFFDRTGDDFRKSAIEILNSPAKKIILDLRNNPGGYLDIAREISGWFLKDGDIVVIEDSGPGKEKKEDKVNGNEKFLDYPIIVLINQGSASASEILAGALRDNRNVLLIGEKSFGKGSIQTLEELRGGSRLKVTIANWLTPKGQLITDKGLEPDIKVEMTEKDYEEGKDPQLEKALEVIKNL